MSNKLIRNSTTEFLIFTGQSGDQSIEARYEDESIWLTQKLMAELFGVDVRTISEHLANIYTSQELMREATIRKFRTVQQEGSRNVTRTIEHYSLDAIISVGYRVNSLRATQFRQWATSVLRDFAIKGYVIDRERMESGASIRKSPTSMPPAWITTARRRPPKPSSPRCRTNCITPSMAIPLPNW